MKKTKKQPLKDYRFARFISRVSKESGHGGFFREFPGYDRIFSFVPEDNRLEILNVLHEVEPLCESIRSFAASFLHPEKSQEVFSSDRLLAVVSELRRFHRVSADLNSRLFSACVYPSPSHAHCQALDKVKSQFFSAFFWLPCLADLFECAAASPAPKITLTTVFVMLTQGSTQTLTDYSMFLYSLEQLGLFDCPKGENFADCEVPAPCCECPKPSPTQH